MLLISSSVIIINSASNDDHIKEIKSKQFKVNFSEINYKNMHEMVTKYVQDIKERFDIKEILHILEHDDPYKTLRYSGAILCTGGALAWSAFYTARQVTKVALGISKAALGTSIAGISLFGLICVLDEMKKSRKEQ